MDEGGEAAVVEVLVVMTGLQKHIFYTICPNGFNKSPINLIPLLNQALYFCMIQYGIVPYGHSTCFCNVERLSFHN